MSSPCRVARAAPSRRGRTTSCRASRRARRGNRRGGHRLLRRPRRQRLGQQRPAVLGPTRRVATPCASRVARRRPDVRRAGDVEPAARADDRRRVAGDRRGRQPEHHVAHGGDGRRTGPSPASVRSISPGRRTRVQTWSTPVVVTKVTNLARTRGEHTMPLASSASSFPRMAVDSQNGNLYIVYNQGRPARRLPPAATRARTTSSRRTRTCTSSARSTTGRRGRRRSSSTTTRCRRSRAPGSYQTRHPSIAVAPNGRVDIVWEDRRHWYQGRASECLHTHIFCDDARLGDTYYAYSNNNGSTFSAPTAASATSRTTTTSVTTTASRRTGPSVPADADGQRQAIVGWMDSREGSFETDNQDIYLAKVDFAAGAAVPQENIDQTDPVAPVASRCPSGTTRAAVRASCSPASPPVTGRRS